MTPEQAIDLIKQVGGTVYRNRHHPKKPAATFKPKQLMDFVAAIELRLQAESAELKAKLEQAMEAGLDFEGRAYRAEKKLAEHEKRYPKSAAETHPMIPNSKCKCEHWQRCPECTPSLKVVL